MQGSVSVIIIGAFVARFDKLLLLTLGLLSPNAVANAVA